MLFACVECADGDGGLFVYGPVFVVIVYMFGLADERSYRAVVGMYVLDVDGLDERWDNGVRSLWEYYVDEKYLPFL